MNLLGAIGKLMEGSGLSSILEEVYGDNAVVHYVNWKSIFPSYSRTFHGGLCLVKYSNGNDD